MLLAVTIRYAALLAAVKGLVQVGSRVKSFIISYLHRPDSATFYASTVQVLGKPDERRGKANFGRQALLRLRGCSLQRAKWATAQIAPGFDCGRARAM